MPPLPVTVLTGFLGAGKTTLLRRLLASPFGKRIGLILNERGIAGIDDVGPRESNFVELADGCVCCVDQPDLVAALTQLHARGDLDRVILETAGLADPLPITWTLGRPDLADAAALDAVVAVVDAANQQHTQVTEWQEQVSCADMVVLTKTDIVVPDSRDIAGAARRAVLAANPRARIFDGDDGLLALVTPEALAGDLRPGRRATAAAHAHHSDFASVSVAEPAAAFDAAAFEDLLDDLPAAVYRAKGIVRLGDGRWARFQAVGGRASFDPDAAPPAHRETRMLFFGRNLTRATVDTLLAPCRT